MAGPPQVQHQSLRQPQHTHHYYNSLHYEGQSVQSQYKVCCYQGNRRSPQSSMWSDAAAAGPHLLHQDSPPEGTQAQPAQQVSPAAGPTAGAAGHVQCLLPVCRPQGQTGGSTAPCYWLSYTPHCSANGLLTQTTAHKSGFLSEPFNLTAADKSGFLSEPTYPPEQSWPSKFINTSYFSCI